MDIEKLSKSQIVLLTLLISFVTSIATGIVTVSLMDQAPPAIAQTVNRVIERTVEKVVPSSEASGQAAATVVTTEKTVVVKESDLIVEAVGKVKPSLVQLYTVSTNPEFLGLGIVFDSGGGIAVDAASLGVLSDVTVEFSDGLLARAIVVSRDKDRGIAILQSATTTSEGKPIALVAATLASGGPVLGQTVVVLSGKNIPRIEDGLVTALIPQSAHNESIIDTNVSGEFIIAGSPVIDTEGDVLGVSTSVSRASSMGGFISSSAILQQASGREE